jgi:hypothetical protein
MRRFTSANRRTTVSLDLHPTIGSPQRSGRRIVPRPDRRERRRRARQDRLAARLAELYCIRALLADAATVVSAGWLQHHWFAVTDTQGKRSTVSAYNLHLTADRPVSDACLVGSIVQAAGGPSTVHSQLVQRTLDPTWHALYEDTQEPVRWCPAPPIRTAHVRDLTRWNDRPGRTAEQVVDFLRSAQLTAEHQAELLRVH